MQNDHSACGVLFFPAILDCLLLFSSEPGNQKHLGADIQDTYQNVQPHVLPEQQHQSHKGR